MKRSNIIINETQRKSQIDQQIDWSIDDGSIDLSTMSATHSKRARSLAIRLALRIGISSRDSPSFLSRRIRPLRLARCIRLSFFSRTVSPSASLVFASISLYCRTISLFFSGRRPLHLPHWPLYLLGIQTTINLEIAWLDR